MFLLIVLHFLKQQYLWQQNLWQYLCCLPASAFTVWRHLQTPNMVEAERITPPFFFLAFAFPWNRDFLLHLLHPLWNLTSVTLEPIINLIAAQSTRIRDSSCSKKSWHWKRLIAYECRKNVFWSFCGAAVSARAYKTSSNPNPLSVCFRYL